MQKKFTVQEKLDAVHTYLNGTGSQRGIARAFETKQSVIQRWIANYQSMGEDAFYRK